VSAGGHRQRYIPGRGKSGRGGRGLLLKAELQAAGRTAGYMLTLVHEPATMYSLAPVHEPATMNALALVHEPATMYAPAPVQQPVIMHEPTPVQQPATMYTPAPVPSSDAQPLVLCCPASLSMFCT